MTPPCGVPLSRATRLPSAICTGAFSHLFDVEKHPRAIRVLAHRPHQQIRIDAVEEALDVEIKNPVTTPASLPRHADRIERRFAGSVSIGVRVEAWLHQRLQVPLDHHLGDAVGDRGNPQRPRLAIALRYVDPPHRRRKVAARRQPIPELVEVVRKISLEVRNRSVRRRQPPLGWLSPSCRLPTLPVSECQTALPYPRGSSHRRLTSRPELNNATPSLQPHYRAFIPTTGRSAPVPRIGTLTLMGAAHLDFSLRIGATGSHVPRKSLVQSHATFMPDAAWAAIRHPPDSSRVNDFPPVSTSSIRFRHVISGSLSLVSLNLT